MPLINALDLTTLSYIDIETLLTKYINVPKDKAILYRVIKRRNKRIIELITEDGKFELHTVRLKYEHKR